MNRNKIFAILSTAAMATAMLTTTNVAQAWNMGNMMNPGKWFDNDDDDDYYRHRYYRYGGYGWGGGPYGWGGGPYGWGGGPYGWGGYPGYGTPSTIVVNPSSNSKSPPPRLPE